MYYCSMDCLVKLLLAFFYIKCVWTKNAQIFQSIVEQSYFLRFFMQDMDKFIEVVDSSFFYISSSASIKFRSKTQR